MQAVICPHRLLLVRAWLVVTIMRDAPSANIVLLMPMLVDQNL